MTDALPQITCPFVIAVDTAEQQPFDFSRVFHSKDQLWKIATARLALGRHPDGYGDYSICGYERQVAIERKSQSDSYSTLLGFKDGHRDRFEDELANLSEIVACVIVECSFEQWLHEAPETPQRSAAENRKALFRSYTGCIQDYGVPWIFAETRALAAICCFNFLNRFWEKVRKGEDQRGNHIRGGAGRGDRNSVRRRRWRRDGAAAGSGTGGAGSGSGAGAAIAAGGTAPGGVGQGQRLYDRGSIAGASVSRRTEIDGRPGMRTSGERGGIAGSHDESDLPF